MRRLLVASISLSVVIVVASILYHEFNVRRLKSEVNKLTVESSAAPIATPSLSFEISPKINDTVSVENPSASETTEDTSFTTSEDINNLYGDEILPVLEDEECCPEDSEVTGDKSLVGRLPAYSGEKARLLEKYGDTYEVNAYLRLLRKEVARERESTIAELLEFYRLHAHFNPEPENVAGYENARRTYGGYNPNARILKIYSDNSTQPLRVGDTFQLSEEDSELLLNMWKDEKLSGRLNR